MLDEVGIVKIRDSGDREPGTYITRAEALRPAPAALPETQE